MPCVRWTERFAGQAKACAECGVNVILRELPSRGDPSTSYKALCIQQTVSLTTRKSQVFVYTARGYAYQQNQALPRANYCYHNRHHHRHRHHNHHRRQHYYHRHHRRPTIHHHHHHHHHHHRHHPRNRHHHHNITTAITNIATTIITITTTTII